MKQLDTKTQLKEAISYLKKSDNYIAIAVILFVISTGIGLIFAEHFTFLDEILKKIIAQTQGLNALEMIFFILQNNLQSALLSVIFGVFFGIFPLFATISNGAVIGYVLARAYEIGGIGVWWRLAPHGIFELPAIFISLGLGIKLGCTLFKAFPFLPSYKKNFAKEFRNRFYQSLNVFLMIIIPLLIIAAIIEGFLIVFT